MGIAHRPLLDGDAGAFWPSSRAPTSCDTEMRVEIRPMGGVEAAKFVRAGEAADVVVLASKVMARP